MKLIGFDSIGDTPHPPKIESAGNTRVAVAPAISSGVRAFEGGKDSRLLKDFPGIYGSINSEIFESHRMLVGRSRALAVDNPYIKRWLALCRVNIVGDHGLRVLPRLRRPDGKFNKKKNELIQKHWKRWGSKKNCTVSGTLSWLQVQKLIVETVKRDGEVLVKLVRGFGNEYGFAIDVIDPDYLDLQYDVGMKPDGTYIRASVEFDKWNRPIAYHLLTQHPGDNIVFCHDSRYRQRIPAKDILHIFETVRPGQVRGFPATHAALVGSKHLHEYKRSTLIAARVIAAKFAVITTPASDGFKGPMDTDGNIKDQVEPGMIWRLNQGQDIKFNNPTQPTGEFDPFTRVLIQELSVALNVSYASLSEDLSRANFGSQRTSLTGERDGWKMEHVFYAEELVDPVFSDMIPMGMMNNKELRDGLDFIDLDDLRDPTVLGRGWAWIDPNKDAQANERQVRLGSMTYEQLYATQGKSLAEQFDQVEYEQQLIEEKGLNIGPEKQQEQEQPTAEEATIDEEAEVGAGSKLRVTG